MGKTVTTNNLFDKPDSIKRLDLGGRQISEHRYHYDGIGRTAEEYDAAGNWTRYEYDAFDRMTKTLLPDGNEVERQYARHSREDLPVKISVNGVVLGEQGFDGLDRMEVSITGGRESRYTFDPGQSQPKSVKRPSGLETGYVYRPELGEDPEQRIAVESTAIYTYDPQNARLRSTEEEDEAGIKHSLVREYFSTGELKSERREKTGETPRIMHYEYSRQARLMSYTDVLGQTQTFEYDQYARLTATTLGATRSTFTYDELGQLKGIETLDGSQRLKVDLEYDDFGREILRKFDLGNQIRQTLSQTYDEVDRLTLRELKQGTETLRKEDYKYDERGRLVEYSCTGSQPPEDPYGKTIRAQLFGFDAQDNLDFVETTFEGGRNSSYYEYTNEADPCQLTAITNTFQPDYPARIEFTYDLDGNLLQDEAGRRLTYDSLDRLISVSALPGETANDYHYDPLDTLSGCSTSGNNEQRFYQNGELTNQIQGDNSSTFVRADAIVLAEHQAGAIQKSLLLASDDKNSVLFEVGREAVQDIAYSPYGHRPDVSSVSGHLGYNGERRETQTGWYLLGNGYRAFNPLLMRFHSPDSLSPFKEGGLNTYTYCLGNPIKFTNPTGHMLSVGQVIKLVADELLDLGVNVTKAGTQASRQVVFEGAAAVVSNTVTKTAKTSELIALQASYITKTTGGGRSGVAELSAVPGTTVASTKGPQRFNPNMFDSPSKIKQAVQLPANINHSAQGRMPLPSSSKAAPAPRKVKPFTPAPNPSQARIDELNGKIKTEQSKRRDYMVDEQKIAKWKKEINLLSVRR